VTAAAAALCGFEARGELLDHLRRTRDEDGGWTGYWWCGRAYPTALAVESLADPAAPLSSAIEATIKWACENAAARPDDSPSAFDLAGYLTILCFAKDGEAAAVSRELIKTIYKLQLPDGSWPPSAAMRIPPPYVTDPESYHDWVYGGRGGGSILLDGRGIYTTATVVKALQLAKMLAEKPA
jgi:hypothetical protein